MSKILETNDEAVLLEVKAIQDELGGATIGGQPRIGCKKIDGKYVPLDQLPGYTPDKWAGTKEIHAVEVDATDPRIKRLELTEDMVTRIEDAKAKKAEGRTAEEVKLAKADVVKDKSTEPTALEQ